MKDLNEMPPAMHEEVGTFLDVTKQKISIAGKKIEPF